MSKNVSANIIKKIKTDYKKRGFCSLNFFNVRARRFHFLKYKELLFGWIFFIFLSFDLKVRSSNML